MDDVGIIFKYLPVIESENDISLLDKEKELDNLISKMKEQFGPTTQMRIIAKTLLDAVKKIKGNNG